MSGVYKPKIGVNLDLKQEFKTKWRSQKLYKIQYIPYRVPNRTERTDTYKPYRTRYGEASRLARNYATCQEPCGGAINCTRYEDRTVRVPYKNLQTYKKRTVPDTDKLLRTGPL